MKRRVQELISKKWHKNTTVAHKPLPPVRVVPVAVSFKDKQWFSSMDRRYACVWPVSGSPQNMGTAAAISRTAIDKNPVSTSTTAAVHTLTSADPDILFSHRIRAIKRYALLFYYTKIRRRGQEKICFCGHFAAIFSRFRLFSLVCGYLRLFSAVYTCFRLFRQLSRPVFSKRPQSSFPVSFQSSFRNPSLPRQPAHIFGIAHRFFRDFWQAAN